MTGNPKALLRRAAAVTLAFTALASACGKPAGVKAVVLITMESIGARQTAAGHGGWSTTDTTPPEGGVPFAPSLPEELDDLAVLGIRFSNAMAPSTSAFASLASLHTGRPPEEAGVYNDLDTLAGMPTLAEVLALANVRSGAFVAREALTPASGLARGFDAYEVFTRRGGGSTGSLAARAKLWVDAMQVESHGRPLFLWVHLSGGRPPYEPGHAFAARLAPNADPALGSLASLEAMAADPPGVSLSDRQKVASLHAATVLQDARLVSLLLVALRSSLDDYSNTMIVFAGTNGELAGEGALAGSRCVLGDATLHVPLSLWKRGLKGLPRVASPVVELRDVTATVAAFLNVPPPEGCRGRDLLTLVRDPLASEHGAFATFENRIFTLRTQRERIVCNPRGISIGSWPGARNAAVRDGFYRIDLDPRESVNRAAENPLRARQLRLLLERERASVKVVPPRPETDVERLRLLTAEGIHGGERHFEDAAPTSACGGGR